MARIRSIKPEFCTSEQLAECSPTARLLFILMWCHCDDAGRHPASAKRLKMECFPADSFTAAEMENFVTELIDAELIVEYEVNSKCFWQITGWHHQKIDKPTYRYPPSSRDGNPLPLSDCSATIRRGLVEASGTESSRSESIGVESISAAASEAAESVRRIDLEEASRNASKLAKACKSLPKEFVWQCAVISEAISPGMLSDIVTKVSGGGIRSPKSYIEGALRKESEKLDFDWRDLIPLVPELKCRKETISAEEFEHRRSTIILNGRRAKLSAEEVESQIAELEKSLRKEKETVNG